MKAQPFALSHTKGTVQKGKTKIRLWEVFMKGQVYRKLLSACVSVSLGTALLAGCGDSAGTTGTKTELTTEAQNEAQAANAAEAQKESETQTEVQESNTSEDVCCDG